MNYTEFSRWALWLSFPLAVLLAVSSLAGLLVPSIYARETRLVATLNTGGDALNLIVVVPVLIVGAVLALRGSLWALLVWMSALVYLLYDYIYYALSLHFNAMFLVYCAILGLSFYALVGSVPALPVQEVAQHFGPRAPVRTTAAVLLLMGLGTIFHWLSESIPALLAGRVPQTILDAGQSTEAVAVLDLAFGAPASIIAAILLLWRKPLGFVLGPVLLTFLVLSSLGLASMGTLMAIRGFKTGFGLFAVSLGLAVGSAVLLALFLRGGREAQA